jgi:hypothetical protein
MNPGIKKIRQTGGHVAVDTENMVLEFVTWDFVLGPKGLYFILDIVDPWQSDPGSVHTLEGKVEQLGPTKFFIERDDGYTSTLQTLADGFEGDQSKVERYLGIHAERLKTETPDQKRWRSVRLSGWRKLLGGDLA